MSETPLRTHASPVRSGMDHIAPPLHILGYSGTFDSAYYLQQNPDLRHLGAGALRHYHQHGWREGRKPNPFFDPHWYLEQNRAVIGDPLLHYVQYGEREGRRPVAWFDPTWYAQNHAIPDGMLALAHYLLHRHQHDVRPIPEFDPQFYLRAYPDVASSGLDPLEHYMIQGFREIRKPYEGFDPVYYRAHYMNHAPDSNPLLHYLDNKHRPGVFTAQPATIASPFREARRRAAPGPFFEDRSALPDGAVRRARVLAYYLPQFHAIPENDFWWGEGFTEWNNIARGMPRFVDHYQPRIPRDLGHYTLDNPEILRRQAAMAREAGIEGFVFYYYWFDGRRLLDTPLEILLANPDIDLPFCLMWANESWSRRWDGSEDDVLIAQDYREETEAALVDDVARHMRDPRYIHVAGRPVLMVYRPGVIPDCPQAVHRWRALFRERHDLEPILIMGQAFGDEDPTTFGLDGAIEFPPHKVVAGCRLLNDETQILDHDFSAQIYDYAEVVERALDLPPPDYPLIRTAAPSWDNDARRQGRGLVLHGSTPALYERWLDGLVAHARRNPFFGESIVCINAWNEWAEGAYLEPDQHFGSAYLNATSRVIAGFEQSGRKHRLLLVGHDAFPAGAQRLLLEIGRNFRRDHGADIRFILLEGGDLLADYQAVAPTEILSLSTPSTQLRILALAKEGFSAAIVNSAASSAVASVLDHAAIAFTFLVHELENLIRARNLSQPLHHAASRAHRIVAPQNTIAERLGIAHYETLNILPQGLYARPSFSLRARTATRRALGIGPNDIMIMGAGYGDMRKGFDLFLQLAQHTADRPAHFVWAGRIADELKDALGAEIEAVTQEGRLHLAGHVNDITPYLSAADAFVLTSREDPYPSVVLEALATGLPCCAFGGSGGIPPLLQELSSRDGQTHHVVPRGNVQALHDAAIRAAQMTLAEAPKIRRHRARRNNARSSFQNYTRALLSLTVPKLPRISVVVLSCDYGHYLEGRLSSIFAQTLPVHEVILLDDASRDDSVVIARRVASQWKRTLRIVQNETRSGSVFKQWQKAASIAQGDWIWIAEADDLAEADFLETLATTLLACPQAVMAFSDSRAIDAQGITIMPSYRPYCAESAGNTLDHDGYYSGRDFVHRCLSERNLVLNVSGAIFDRSAFARAMRGCRPDLSRLRAAGDWRVYIELLDRPDVGVCYTARPLNIHRRHAASTTHQQARTDHVSEIRVLHDRILQRTSGGEIMRRRQDQYVKHLLQG